MENLESFKFVFDVKTSSVENFIIGFRLLKPPAERDRHEAVAANHKSEVWEIQRNPLNFN
jgi:hypothetical protein